MRQLDLFVNGLNNKHVKIKFKKELEENLSLNFLDLTINRFNNKHQFKIYRKPTYTDAVIPASSNHPWQHKLAAFHCYVHRLLTVPLSREDFDLELNTIYQIALSNGYTKSMINSLVQRKQARIVNSMLYAVLPSQSSNKYRCSISYVGRLSDRICGILKSNNVKVAFRTNNSLYSKLCNHKEKVDKGTRSGVYKLTCNDCSKVYVGQTGRSFNARFKEHVSAYRNEHPDKSNFAKHLLELNHSLSDSDSYEVLHYCGKGFRLDVLECMEIIRYNKNKTKYTNKIKNNYTEAGGNGLRLNISCEQKKLAALIFSLRPDYVDISVAVATPRGLVVPVLRNVESMDYPKIELTMAAIAEKARTGKLTPADMQGGTFTISNGGVFGSLISMPIINLPQSAILGMHAIVQRPVAVGSKVEIRPMMYLALSYDHRLIDGREAVLFLRKVKSGVEDPTSILAGM
ncbi:hypothetical protein MSG28_007086 [Choristoneura fumiferana]|uniref:Uncharacterized protein n=1 Tax=Choristoneura fumiferana TaxID=7141 RepID=A0ACC0JMG1_CHOFU|nr:hypothetical protein MSG28_007086 [Choristoneura fumiferana]